MKDNRLKLLHQLMKIDAILSRKRLSPAEEHAYSLATKRIWEYALEGGQRRV